MMNTSYMGRSYQVHGGNMAEHVVFLKLWIAVLAKNALSFSKRGYKANWNSYFEYRIQWGNSCSCLLQTVLNIGSNLQVTASANLLGLLPSFLFHDSYHLLIASWLWKWWQFIVHRALKCALDEARISLNMVSALHWQGNEKEPRIIWRSDLKSNDNVSLSCFCLFQDDCFTKFL